MQSVKQPPRAGAAEPISIPRQEFKRSEPSPSPQRDPNVVRSEDAVNEGQFLPPPQTTRGLVAKFKQLEVDSVGQASVAPAAAGRRATVPNYSTQPQMHANQRKVLILRVPLLTLARDSRIPAAVCAGASPRRRLRLDHVTSTRSRA